MTEKQCRTGVIRRYRTRSEADQLAAEFEASGLTRREFWEHNAVAVNTLARYLRWHVESGEMNNAQFVAVDIAEPAGPAAVIAVVLRGGRRIEVGRGFDGRTLQQVVTLLEHI